jgi:hypothetical protein
VRNAALEQLDGLVGDWAVTMSDAWFLEPRDTVISGKATITWLGESFLVWRTELGGDQHAHSATTWVLGRSDAQERFVALYHDDRGVCREFDLTFDGVQFAMSRDDPDMYQRIVAEVEKDRIVGRTEASDDQGQTWRKDFDLTFERA